MSSSKDYAQLRSNEILTSVQSSPPTTPCTEGNTSCRVAAVSSNDDLRKLFLLYDSFLGSQMCSVSLTNSNIFSISGDHIFKAYSVTSRRK
ncbi:hypothetical protein E2C01_073779 [Portunus trituberculatus]|uniref:Uncharacterized protein n=1 Tax=Portunus trituberculatus TaxID=210409 RepID=A0A5B7IAD3_PORTR|nr:hypothetical protein [Portunus trituberculatus]